MIEDELWFILGIVLLLIAAVIIYLAFTSKSFQDFLKNWILSFKLPKPWKK